MVHLFVSPNQIEEKVIHITGSDVNHVKNVLRMKVGEEISVSADSKTLYLCKVLEIRSEEVLLSIDRKENAESELNARMVLFQGLPKGDKMETIIQKAVELGVAEVCPVKMKRCIVKVEEKKEQSKIDRYQAIAESAAKQSGRNIIPQIDPFMTLKEALNYCKDFNHIFVPYEKADGMQQTKDFVQQVQQGDSIAVFIGPEGGFEESEIEEIVKAGGKSITLGKRILRTETAGMTFLSVLMFHLSE